MASPEKLSLSSLAGSDWLEWPGVVSVFSTLSASGDEVRAVGGAVRDTLLSRPVREIDFATTAAPEKVMELAQKSGLKTVATGLEHGTVTVIADGRGFEVTTLRKDVETYGRRAKVAYTDDWVEDAARRDFTINALYADSDGTLYDPLGAYDDVLARRVRFIGDAAARVREDYLRILRFFRFNAELLADAFDEDGLNACVRARGGLAGLSGERVQAELLQLLKAPGAIVAVEKLFDHGLLVGVVGAVPQLARFERLTQIEAAMGNEPDSILRLGALAVMVLEDARRLAQRLRLSNADRSHLEQASSVREFSADMHNGDISWGLYRRGRDAFLAGALIKWADSGASAGDAMWRSTIARIKELPIPQFSVTGADLVELGVAKGPAIRNMLSALELHWMANGFDAKRAELLDVARTLAAETDQHREK